MIKFQDDEEEDDGDYEEEEDQDDEEIEDEDGELFSWFDAFKKTRTTNILRNFFLNTQQTNRQTEINYEANYAS